MTVSSTPRSPIDDAYARLVTELPSRELVDRRVLAVALTGADGRVLAATPATPLANVEAVVAGYLAAPHPAQPGDVVITNDPYAGGTRVQDHFVVAPAYRGDELAGFAVVCAPYVDVGGMSLGNDVPDAGDLFTEGVRTRLVRIRRGGHVDQDVIECLKLNSRVPVLIEADVTVMADVATALAAEVLDASGFDDELAATRAALDDLLARDGEATAEGRVTHPASPEALELRLKMTLAGGELIADFTGSAGQFAAGNVNATIHTTRSAVIAALHAAAGGPLNGALTEAVRVVAPEPSIVAAALPAPVGGALASIVPEVTRMAGECLAAIGRSTT
jgi:N-methylhydantoinase B